MQHGCVTGAHVIRQRESECRTALPGPRSYNLNAGTVYIFWYNTTTTPGTIGSTTNLIYQIGIATGSAAHISLDNGIAFSSGIAVAVSTSATSSAAPGTGLVITTLYK